MRVLINIVRDLLRIEVNCLSLLFFLPFLLLLLLNHFRCINLYLKREFGPITFPLPLLNSLLLDLIINNLFHLFLSLPLHPLLMLPHDPPLLILFIDLLLHPLQCLLLLDLCLPLLLLLY